MALWQRMTGHCQPRKQWDLRNNIRHEFCAIAYFTTCILPPYMSLPRRRTRVWMGVSLRVCCDSSTAPAVRWLRVTFWMGPGFSTLLRECVIGVPNGNGENGDVAREAGLAAVEDICLCGVTSSMASNGEKAGEGAAAGWSRREDMAQLPRNVAGDFRRCVQHVGPREGHESARRVDGNPVSIDSAPPLAWTVRMESPPRGHHRVGACPIPLTARTLAGNHHVSNMESIRG